MNKYAHQRSPEAKAERRNRFKRSTIGRHYGCIRKVQRTEKEATVTAAWRGLRAYKCPHCTWWHLTSKGVESVDPVIEGIDG